MPDPYFSELRYKGSKADDFIEISFDPGTDISNFFVTIYNSGGGVRSTNSLVGLTPTNSFGRDVYIIDDSLGTFNGLGATNGISLSDGNAPGDTVYSFFSFEGNSVTANAGTAAGGSASTNIGTNVTGESLTSEDGAGYTVETNPSPGTASCLTVGTSIMTPKGQIPVENLMPGDLITTIDGANRPLASVMHQVIGRKELIKNPKLYPIRICEGALGNGLPRCDLWVSRQHRMLVASPIAQRIFGTSKVLVAAIKLIDLPGIFIDDSVRSVTYYHLLFQAHEVIFAEDAPTESLFLGEEAVKALPQSFLAEIATIFPNFRHLHANAQTSPVIAKGPKQKQLVKRHAINQKPLVAMPL